MRFILFHSRIKHLLLAGLLAAGLQASAQTDNISGTITCGGIGVEGVVVSDGYVVTRTDADGKYSFYSQKKNGYVFYEIPSGYMPYENYRTSTEDKIFTKFWSNLNFPNTVSKAEQHDFKLTAVNNENFIMLVGADPQIANRANDVKQYTSLFLPRAKEEYQAAGSTPIYSTFLGDLAWDNYWYKNNWGHSQYKALLISNYNYFKMKHFSVIGNHDHDGATPQTDSTDFMSAAAFRDNMGPNYYAYNIGKIHFVVLDNIIYKNTYTAGTSYSTGIVGDRDYTEGFTQVQVDFLKKDLAFVDYDTPIVVEMHAPLWYINSNNVTTSYNRPLEAAVTSLLSKYKTVHFWNGHRHKTYNMFPIGNSNIHEHTLGAVGGDLYNAGYYGGHPTCQDGTPGGYQLFYFKGDTISWIHKGIEEINKGQFRVVDGNTLKKFYETDATAQALVAAGGHQDFSQLSNNAIIVNVFNHDPKWKVYVYEGNKSLYVSRYRCQDIYHTLCYDYPYFKQSGKVPSSGTEYNMHSFMAIASGAETPITVKVVDRFGNQYIREVQRPLECSTTGYAATDVTFIPTGIVHSITNNSKSKVYTSGNNICIEADKAGKAQITYIDGASKNVSLNVGHNEISTNRKGIHIVTIDQTSTKIFVK